MSKYKLLSNKLNLNQKQRLKSNQIRNYQPQQLKMANIINQQYINMNWQDQKKLRELIIQVNEYLKQKQQGSSQQNFDQTGSQVKQQLNPQSLRKSIQRLFTLVQQKDQTINSLGQKLTKYKCESINHTKTIISLQDKLNKLQPNLNNTGSNFMMPSQFKDSFENFMNSHLTMALDPFLQIQNTERIPIIFSDVVRILFDSYYANVQRKLAQIINKIAQTLNLTQNSKQYQQTIFNNLLRVFQDNWKVLFPSESLNIQFPNKIRKKYQTQIQEMKQSQQFVQMSQQLHKLCVYMNLQQKKWNFLWQPLLTKENQSNILKNNGKRIIEFDKKQFICLDGFVKENSTAIVILQGLVRQQHKHAGIKSYVLPCNSEQLCDSISDQSNQNFIQPQQQLTQVVNQVSQNTFIESKRHFQAQKQQKKEQIKQLDQIKEKQARFLVCKDVSDKFEGKIVKLTNTKQNLDLIQERQKLTLHKILMDRGKRQNPYRSKQDTKINNWISQKKNEMNSNFEILKNKQTHQNQIHKSRQKSVQRQKSLIKGISKRKKGISQINLSNALQKIQYCRSRQQGQYQFASQKYFVDSQGAQNVSPNLFFGKDLPKNMKHTDSKTINSVGGQGKFGIKCSPKMVRTDSSKVIKPENSQKNFCKLYHDNIISKAEKSKTLQRKKSFKQLQDQYPESCLDKLKNIDDTDYQIARLKKLRKDMAKGTLNNFKALNQKRKLDLKEQDYNHQQIGQNRKQNVQPNNKKNNKNAKKTSIGKIVTQNPIDKYHDIIKSSILNSQIVKTSTERDQNRPLKCSKLRNKYL